MLHWRNLKVKKIFTNDYKKETTTTSSPLDDKKVFSNDKREATTTPSPFDDQKNSSNSNGKIFTNTPGF